MLARVSVLCVPVSLHTCAVAIDCHKMVMRARVDCGYKKWTEQDVRRGGEFFFFSFLSSAGCGKKKSVLY